MFWVSVCSLGGFVLLAGTIARAGTAAVADEFTTTAFRDASATTAAWDTAAGVIRLPTNESPWRNVNGLQGKSITAAAFSPAFAADRMILAGAPDGIYRSTDRGGSWTRVALTGQAVTRIAYSPSFETDDTVIAITNGGGTWRSVRSGMNWTKVGEGSGFGIAFASEATAFAAAFTNVLRSDDGGATWDTLPTTGMDPVALQNGDIRGIAVSPTFASDQTLYVTTLSGGVHRSTNGGSTWTAVNPPAASVTSATAIAAGADGLLVAAFFDGAFRSPDRGATWLLLTDEETNDAAILADGTVVLATSQGVRMWDDGAFLAPKAGWTAGAARALGAYGSRSGPLGFLAGRANGAMFTLAPYTTRAIAASLAVDRVAERILTASLSVVAATPTGTSVQYEVSAARDANGAPIWEGPVTLGVPWKFRQSGSDLRWRATLSTTDVGASPVLDRMAIGYTTSDEVLPPSPPVPGDPIAGVTGIRWVFTDVESGEEGFEVRAGAPGSLGERVVASTRTANAAFLDETGLTPNTAYCERYVYTYRDGRRSAPSRPWPCATTLAETPSAPTVLAVGGNSAVLGIGAGGNPSATEYAIRDERSGKYVSAARTFGGDAPAWQARAIWGEEGVTITELAPGTAYAFCALARNRVGVATACSTSTAVTTTSASGAVTLAIALAPEEGPPVPVGATIRVVMTLANTGVTPAANGVVVAAPMPLAVAYVPGSLAMGGSAMSDASDADSAEYGTHGERVALYRIPALPVGGRVMLAYTVRVQSADARTVGFTAQAYYRSAPRQPPTTVSGGPASIAVIRAPREVIADVLEVTEPQAGAVFAADAPIVLRGVAVSASSPTIALDGGLPKILARDANGRFSVALGIITPGAHEFVVTAGSLRHAIAFTVREPFPMTIAEPPEGAHIIADVPVTVVGSGPPNAEVTLRVDEGPGRTVVSGDDGRFTVALGMLAVGAHRLEASAGSSHASRAITVDPIPPPDVVRIDAPLTGAVFAVGEDVVVQGRAPEGAAVAVLVDAQPRTEVRADDRQRFTIALGPLALGEHTITARDGATSDAVTISVGALSSEEENRGEEEIIEEAPPREVIPPRFTLTTPRDGSVFDLPEVRVEGAAPPGASVTIALDGDERATVAAQLNGAFAASLTGLSAGPHLIAATSGFLRIEVRIVVAAPPEAVRIARPADGAALNASVIAVEGRSPPDATLVITVDAAEVGRTQSDADGNFAFTIRASVGEGAHRIGVRTTVRGVERTAEVGVAVDRTLPPAPVVAAVEILNRTALTGGAFAAQLRLRGSVPQDALDELDAIFITVASDPQTFTVAPSGAQWAYELTVPLDLGTHSIRVATRDRAGNVSLASAPFAFAIAPPACADGTDNDGDGMTDFPNDADCTGAFDDREHTPGALTTAANVAVQTTVAAARVVASGTTAAARGVARAAEAVAITVQERVLDNPAVEVATERIVVPTVAVAVVANTATAAAATGVQFLGYLQYLVGLLLQPARLLARRKRRGWGTVYGSRTKRPIDLATVRLVDATSGRTIATEVTDTLGRYACIASRPGTYRIVVQHPRYAFPAQELHGKREDAGFVDLYFGEEFTVTEAGALLTMNIPLDAHEEAATAEDIVRTNRLRVVGAAIAHGGLACSIISLGISPRPFVAAALLLNVLLHLLFRRLARTIRRPKSWGVIRDAVTGNPIALAIVRIFDEQFHKLLETTTTDAYGRYSFLVGRNAYHVTAAKLGYATARSTTIDTTRGESVVGVDMALHPGV